MNRRDAIKQSGLLAAAAALGLALPVRTWAALAAPAQWTKADEDLLSAIGDTILPATPGSPGAGAVGIGRFIVVMVSECQPPEAAENLRRGLSDIRLAAAGKNFETLPAPEREAVLLAYEKRAATDAKVRASFQLLKELTLLGYFTSEAGATQALRYDPVPREYRGSVKLAPTDRSWAS